MSRTDHKARDGAASPMNEPQGIVPTAVYDTEQACAVLQIGESKLKELVSDGRLQRLAYSYRWRFFGEDLVDLCRRARTP